MRCRSKASKSTLITNFVIISLLYSLFQYQLCPSLQRHFDSYMKVIDTVVVFFSDFCGMVI